VCVYVCVCVCVCELLWGEGLRLSKGPGGGCSKGSTGEALVAGAQ